MFNNLAARRTAVVESTEWNGKFTAEMAEEAFFESIADDETKSIIPEDVAEETAILSHLDDLDELANIIETSDNPEPIVRYANRAGALDAAVGDMASFEKYGKPEDLAARIREATSFSAESILNFDNDEKTADWEMQAAKEDVLTSAVIGYILGTIFRELKNYIDSLKSSVTIRKAIAWSKWASSIEQGSKWDTAKAKKNKTRAAIPTKDALLKELALAEKAPDLIKNIFTKNILDPEGGEEAYKAWARRSNDVIKQWSDVYGVTVEEKGWFVFKKFKLVDSGLLPAHERKRDLPGRLGYGDKDMVDIAKKVSDVGQTLFRGVPRAYLEVSKDFKAAEARWERIGQKKNLKWSRKAWKINMSLVKTFVNSGACRKTLNSAMLATVCLAHYYSKSDDAKELDAVA